MNTGTTKKYQTHINEKGERVWSITGKKIGRPVIWDEETLIEVGENLIEWLLENDENIYFYKYFTQYDLWDDILNEYSEKYDSFSRLISRAKQIQEQKLIEKAMNNQHNAQFSKFYFINKFGYSDRVEHSLNQIPMSIQFNLTDGNTPSNIPLSPYQEIKPLQMNSGSTGSSSSQSS